MKTILKSTLLTLLFANVSGACMPLPSLNPFKKEVVLMSPLKGTLLKDGKPLANIDIEVVIEVPGREERIYKHQTSASGEFDLPPIKDTMALGPMTAIIKKPPLTEGLSLAFTTALTLPTTYRR